MFLCTQKNVFKLEVNTAEANPLSQLHPLDHHTYGLPPIISINRSLPQEQAPLALEGPANTTFFESRIRRWKSALRRRWGWRSWTGACMMSVSISRTLPKDKVRIHTTRPTTGPPSPPSPPSNPLQMPRPQQVNIKHPHKQHHTAENTNNDTDYRASRYSWVLYSCVACFLLEFGRKSDEDVRGRKYLRGVLSSRVRSWETRIA